MERGSDQPSFATLERLAASISHEWLASRRWAAAHGRTIQAIRLIDAAVLRGDADSPPEGGSGVLLLVEADVAAPDRPAARLAYQLPVMAAPADGSSALTPVHDGLVLREPADGDGVWRTIARAIADGAELPGRDGRFAFRRGATPVDVPRDAAERLLRGEQSNTSAVVGGHVFLKCYRRPDGVNPDAEIMEFLSTRTSFGSTPALLGTAEYTAANGERRSLVIAQDHVSGATDAWTWFLDRLAGGDGAALDASVREIGRVTAELHVALASAPSDAFPSRAATPPEREAWHAAAERQLDDALGVTSGDARRRVAEVVPAIRAALAPLADPGIDAWLSRVHGDYHLGQLLRARRGFLVTDFEGEPARPLEERRRPGSPLKDVAGMLRSFDYAGRTIVTDAGRDPAFLTEWTRHSRSAFLEAYRSAAPSRTDRDGELLRAFEVEKACYEVAYEARNRPAWVALPLDGLEALIGV